MPLRLTSWIRSQASRFESGGRGVTGADAHVVDQHVDASVSFPGGVNDAGAVLLHGDVGMQGAGHPTFGGDHGHGLLR